MLTPLLMQIVAICTERVEAKGAVLHPRHGQRFVAICTERVEAKMTDTFADSANAELQSARSVWRQSKNANWLASAKAVAICTERVEAKYVV